MPPIAIILIIMILSFFIMITILNYLCPFSLIVTASHAGLKIRPSQIIAMRIRKVDPYLIV